MWGVGKADLVRLSALELSQRDRFTYESIDGDRNSQDEVEDEQPSTSRHPTLAVHASEKSGLEMARKHLSDNTAHDEKTTATG